MDAVFPITQRNGEEFHTLSDFKQLFKEVKSGRYILSQGHGWHSGVHLTSKILPYGKGLRPIQAMLSGKIVAYRINPDYQISVYQEQELSFSNNFVLIEHTAKNPDQKKEDDFYFYSLYMHLAPPSDIGANSSVTTRYKLLTGRNVRTFKLDSEPERNKHESTISLPADSVFEYLYAEEKTTKPYAINSKTYNTIKCRVISVGNNANPKQKSLQGKTVWFASGLNSPFDILDNPKVVSKEPMSEPKWMSHSLAQIRDGSVQVISTTNVNNTPIPPEAIISIEAGDDIGYMGLHEYSQDTHATKQEDNRVHIEVFSVKQPPEFFLKSLGPKNAESNGFTLIDGSSSSGALDDSNLLFKEIAEQITQTTQDGTKIDFSSYTPKELKVYLNTKQEKFEKLIVKHASEWHDKSNSHMFNSIVEAGRKILEDKLITRFISRDEYDSSDYKKLVLEAHDKLVDHEKERIDKFAWMQDASELNIPKEIWHFWPFSILQKVIEVGLGKTSERYESGGKGPGVISSGYGDRGGKSYGVYQLASKIGVLQKYLKTSIFKNEFLNIPIASEEFDKKWKEIAKSHNLDFRKDQHDFIKRTHYDIQYKKLISNNTIKETNSAAVNDLIWSTSVQYGPSTSLIIKATKNKSGFGDKELIKMVQDYKYDNVHRLFRSSPTLWPMLKERAKSEKKKLLDLHEKNAVIKEW